jgi:hypothetical protein
MSLFAEQSTEPTRYTAEGSNIEAYDALKTACPSSEA